MRWPSRPAESHSSDMLVLNQDARRETADHCDAHVDVSCIKDWVYDSLRRPRI